MARRSIRNIRTYEDLAEAIFVGIIEQELEEVAKYRPGNTWADLKRASGMGALRGRSCQEMLTEMAKAIEPIVILKADAWHRRMWRKIRRSE